MTDYETVGRGLAPAVKRDGRRDQVPQQSRSEAQLRSRSALNLSQLERREGRLRRPGDSDRLAPRPARTEAVFRTGRALPASGQFQILALPEAGADASSPAEPPPAGRYPSPSQSHPLRGEHRRAPRPPAGPRAPWMEERDSSKVAGQSLPGNRLLPDALSPALGLGRAGLPSRAPGPGASCLRGPGFRVQPLRFTSGCSWGGGSGW
ncbi:hypothetical protein P7K49_002486 [Saguinus oedipus]|uniref:Uncharacterized protein n=1 Tax=Saguinus oedipus TaxID=9490 RepID=A0ABQ9WHG1_SAGOE|nr:hypothetical protein P7K49_002486 [Saguinus oedipus]